MISLKLARLQHSELKSSSRPNLCSMPCRSHQAGSLYAIETVSDCMLPCEGSIAMAMVSKHRLPSASIASVC